MKKTKLLSFVALGLGAALSLSACTQTGTPEEVSPPPAVVDPPPVIETPGVEEPVEEVEWVKFSDPRIEFTFEVPATWSVEDQGGWPAESIYAFTVFDDEGEAQLEYLSRVMSTGEECSDQSIEMQVLELDATPINLFGDFESDQAESADQKEEVTAATVSNTQTFEDETLEAAGATSESDLRFVYRIISAQDFPFVGSVAVASGPAHPGGTCVISNVSEYGGPAVFADSVRINFVNPEHSLDQDFGTLAKAEAFMETEEYATLKRIILSLRAE